jgi:hypothetical protein
MVLESNSLEREGGRYFIKKMSQKWKIYWENNLVKNSIDLMGPNTRWTNYEEQHFTC